MKSLPACRKWGLEHFPPLLGGKWASPHFLACSALLWAAAAMAQPRSATPVYLDPKAPVERRVDDLLRRMTLKEKAGQLNLPCVYVAALGRDVASKTEACKRFAAGTYTDEIGPGSGFFTRPGLS